ncbi:hypothetical protein [Cellulomonas sp. PhB143]|uniref:PH-like domain-containing protein n=1 Tax=Cellulomonas sp. PhB143 TaxID=2485186 RepID=UPI000F4AA132
MPVPVAVGIWIVLGVLLLLVIGFGVRAMRTRRADVVGELPVVPGQLGAPSLGPLEATYVSTTLAGDWLARVGAHHLGDRAAATVSVHPEGVLLERRGSTTLYLPAGRVADAGTSPGMAGKYTGGEGIVVLTWRSAAGTMLDTGLRVRHAADRAPLVEAVQAMAGAEVRPTTDHPEETA